MLKNTFEDLAKFYTADLQLITTGWQEIETAYTAPGRHYHNLAHLEDLFTQLQPLKDQFQDWDITAFAVFYHDLVYSAASATNEEESAGRATDRLRLFSLDEKRISFCSDMILATKTHREQQDNDLNLFTDADLSILGRDWTVYSDYFHKIRKEFELFQDRIYYPGRMNVLEHFLKMPFLFKTSFFRERYEAGARENIKAELQLLNETMKQI